MSRFVAYFDASALAKRYSREQGTELVNEIFRLLPSNARACSVIAIAEVTSILVRMKNDRRIGEAHFASATLKITSEFLDDEEVLLAPVNTALVLASLPLIRQHNLNATDALILLSVLSIRDALQADGRDLFVVTADKRLSRAARAEEVPVCDPELDTKEDLRQILGSEALGKDG